MNVVEFLFKTQIFSSKGDIKRMMKNNAISIDFKKIKNANLELDIEFDELRVFSVGEILSGSNILENKGELGKHGKFGTVVELFDDERVWVKICRKAGFLANFKESDELLDIVFKDLFVVHKSKKEIFLLKLV